MTYAELDAQSNRLARCLVAHGAGPELRIGVCLDRSLEMVVALLGVLKAGAVYVPLDPAYPAQRLAFLVEDAGLAALVTGERFRSQFAFYAGPVLSLDSEAERLAGYRAEHIAVQVAPQNAAYMIYTSGSTGRPKGVMVTHETLTNVAVAQQALFGIEAEDAVLQYASFSFDASLLEFAMALLCGARLVLVRRERLLPGPELIQLLEEECVTAAILTCPVLRAMPDAELSLLRTIVTGGEAATAELVRRWNRPRRCC